MAEGAKLPFLLWATGAEGIKLCQGWAFAVGWGTVSTSWYQKFVLRLLEKPSIVNTQLK